MKTGFRLLLFALLLNLLLVMSASANTIPYWTMAEHTAGDSGTANFALSFDSKTWDDTSFGLFTVNDDVTSVVKHATIFRASDEITDNAVANFTYNGDGTYDLAVSAYNASLELQWTEDYGLFDTVFGFYFIRTNPNPDALIYSDSQFDTNVGLNDMRMVHVDSLDIVSVQLWWNNTEKMAITVADVSPVPEPATMLLFGMGLLGLAGVSRRKIDA